MTEEQGTSATADALAEQDFNAIETCITRGDAPETYAEIIQRLRGNVAKLGFGRAGFWYRKAKAIGVDLSANT